MGEILLSRLDLPGLFDFFLAGRNLVEYLLLIITRRMGINTERFFTFYLHNYLFETECKGRMGALACSFPRRACALA